jgi:micrococcal nuclease
VVKILNLVPIVLLVGLGISFILQNWRSQTLARPDYDDISQPSPRPLIRDLPQTSPECVVTQVVDGDTIHVKCADGNHKIRFCGIDAPELGQPLGEESKANLKRLIDKGHWKVSLVYMESDRYGRDVSEVFNSPTFDKDNELFLNGQQVLDGMAYDYKRFSSRCINGDQLGSIEEQAREKRVGIWDGKSYELPWEFRKRNK